MSTDWEKILIAKGSERICLANSYMKNGLEFNLYRASMVYDKRLIMESPNPIEMLIDDIIIPNTRSSRTNVQKLALNNLISNILVAEKENKVLALPRGSWVYSNSSFYGLDHYSYTNITVLIDGLKKAGFIEYVNGFYNREKKKGTVSRLWATEKLLYSIDQYTNAPLTDDEESEEPNRVHYLFGQKLKRLRFTKPIILKDENKKLIRYKSNKTVLRMQHHIHLYTRLISQHSVTIPSSTILKAASNGSPILVELEAKSLNYIELDCYLYRVFNGGKFTLGGRFYGGEYQGFSEEQRADIRIDGEHTCEVDYSACNIRMLYHMQGMEYKDDPYLIANFDLSMRTYVKKMLHILINAKSIYQSISAYRKYIDESQLSDDIKVELKSTAWELASKIIETHKKLERYFNTGIGRELQYRDSKIAERILMHFTSKKIVCLCIHDSFIVKKQYQDELIEVMHREYRREMGFACELKIT